MTSRKQIPEVPEKRELDFNRCPKHGIRYPAGSECPACKAERARKGGA
jgi:hypothetical protein